MKKKSSNKFNLEDVFLCLQKNISQELSKNIYLSDTLLIRLL